MRRIIRTMGLAGILAVGTGLGLGAAPAEAHEPAAGGYPGGGYAGGGYGEPSYNYYGNGGHDFAPHGHNVQTPVGGFSYYGNGAHDFRPHVNTVSPYGVTSHNAGMFSHTDSYAPPTPYGYRPW